MIIERYQKSRMGQPEATYVKDEEPNVVRIVRLYAANPQTGKVKEKPSIPTGRRLIICLLDNGEVHTVFATGGEPESVGTFQLEDQYRALNPKQSKNQIIHGAMLCKDGKPTLCIYKASPGSVPGLKFRTKVGVVNPFECLTNDVLEGVLSKIGAEKAEIIPLAVTPSSWIDHQLFR